VEAAWRYLRLRACEVTSNAPSAGEPRRIIPSRPTFFVNNDEALTPLEPDRNPATMSCSGCGGFYYCGREHQEMHWSDLDHHESCERTKKQVARTQELRQDIITAFDWGRLATEMLDENVHTRCSLLHRLGAHQKFGFRRECPCLAKVPFGVLELRRDETEDVLKKRVARELRGLLGWVAKHRDEEMEESMKRVRKMKPPPENWEGMIKYRLKGLINSRWYDSEYPEYFRSDLPFAMYSHTAATIDYALRKLANFGSRHSFRNDRFVTVDVLGVEKEIDQLSTTCAALQWLHCIDDEGNMVAPRGIHLNFVGPEVPCDWKLIEPHPDYVKLNFEAYPERGYKPGYYPGVVSTHLHKGLYHDLRTDYFLSPGDGIRMIFMPNAGIAAFTSWQPTLRTIVRRVGDTSVIITDYTEEAANMGMKELKKTVLREKLADAWEFLEVQVNPYRQPVSCKTSDNALPSYANGFIFGMIPRKPKPPKVINLDSDSE
jgi:hypothetical protein